MQVNDSTQLIQILIEKSKEAAYLAVEIMNKPTIHYRTEGFCFFICNAWELLLKAFLIKDKGLSSIELPSRDGKPRTKSLSECMNDVFTSVDNPVKANLEIIVRMRNRATHLVAASDDAKYAPGFQICVGNYFAFLKKSFPSLSTIEMTPFISMAVGDASNSSPLLFNPRLEDFFASDDSCYAPLLLGKLFITRKESEADFTAKISKEGERNIALVGVPKDIEVTHPYTQTTAVKKIKEMLVANGMDSSLFNKYSFGRIKRNSVLRAIKSIATKILIFVSQTSSIPKRLLT